MISTDDKKQLFYSDLSLEEISNIFSKCESDEDFSYLMNLNSGGLDLIQKSCSDGKHELLAFLLGHEKIKKFIDFSSFDNFAIRWAIQNKNENIINLYIKKSEDFKNITKDKFDYYIYFSILHQSFSVLDLFIKEYQNIKNLSIKDNSSKTNMYGLIVNFKYFDIIKKFQEEKFFDNKDLNELLIDASMKIALKSNINFIKVLIFDFNININESTFKKIKLINPILIKDISNYLEIRDMNKNLSKKTDKKFKL